MCGATKMEVETAFAKGASAYECPSVGWRVGVMFSGTLVTRPARDAVAWGERIKVDIMDKGYTFG
jgi:hypothetical protein